MTIDLPGWIWWILRPALYMVGGIALVTVIGAVKDVLKNKTLPEYLTIRLRGRGGEEVWEEDHGDNIDNDGKMHEGHLIPMVVGGEMKGNSRDESPGRKGGIVSGDIRGRLFGALDVASPLLTRDVDHQDYENFDDEEMEDKKELERMEFLTPPLTTRSSSRERSMSNSQRRNSTKDEHVPVSKTPPVEMETTTHPSTPVAISPVQKTKVQPIQQQQLWPSFTELSDMIVGGRGNKAFIASIKESIENMNTEGRLRQFEYDTLICLLSLSNKSKSSFIESDDREIRKLIQGTDEKHDEQQHDEEVEEDEEDDEMVQSIGFPRKRIRIPDMEDPIPCPTIDKTIVDYHHKTVTSLVDQVLSEMKLDVESNIAKDLRARVSQICMSTSTLIEQQVKSTTNQESQPETKSA